MHPEYPTVNFVMNPFAYESLAIDGTAKALTSTVYAPTGSQATRAIITVEDAQIRYRVDGSDPAADEGHLLNPMATLVVIGPKAIANIKFIAKTATAGKIRVTYEK